VFLNLLPFDFAVLGALLQCPDSPAKTDHVRPHQPAPVRKNAPSQELRGEERGTDASALDAIRAGRTWQHLLGLPSVPRGFFGARRGGRRLVRPLIFNMDRATKTTAFYVRMLSFGPVRGYD